MLSLDTVLGTKAAAVAESDESAGVGIDEGGGEGNKEERGEGAIGDEGGMGESGGEIARRDDSVDRP